MSRASTTDLFLRPIAGGTPASPCTPPLVLRRHRLLILTASESHPWPLALISTACTRHLKRGGGTNRAQTGSPPPCSDGHVPAGGNGPGRFHGLPLEECLTHHSLPPGFPTLALGVEKYWRRRHNSRPALPLPPRSHRRLASPPRTQHHHAGQPPEPRAAQKSQSPDLLPCLTPSSRAPPRA